MILQNEHWFDVLPSRDQAEVRIDGKWLHFGPTEVLHSWLKRIDCLVENGQIAAAKIARKLPGIDAFPDNPCVLCVFTPTDKKSRDHARRILKNEFDIDVSIWKSEAQTIEDWQPGGWLQVEAEINQLRRRLEREGLGRGGQARLLRLAENLQRTIEDVEEPSRIAEIEAARAVTLTRQLTEELRLPGVTAHAIVARLDEIQTQLTKLIAKNQAPAPQAALAAVTDDADVVFVIMPFADKHIDTYDAIRRGVGRASAKLHVHRIDELPGAIQITDEVRKAIRKAGLIVCDLTEERPNVYYELGLAHGLNKQVICIARKGTTVHFDIYGLKTLFFDTFRLLEGQLDREIRALRGST